MAEEIKKEEQKQEQAQEQKEQKPVEEKKKEEEQEKDVLDLLAEGEIETAEPEEKEEDQKPDQESAGSEEENKEKARQESYSYEPDKKASYTYSYLSQEDEDKDLDIALEQAKKAFVQKYGREPDEFSLSDGFKVKKMADIAYEQLKKQKVVAANWQKALEELKPLVTSKEISAFVDEEIDNLPVKVGRRIIQKANEGDFSEYISVIKEAVEKYHQQNKKKTSAQEKITNIKSKREMPPMLSSGSSRVSGNKSGEDVEGLALFGLEDRI